VLAGGGERLVRRLSLRPGDLQLFTGRYSLHRVTAVHGGTARHSAIFAYSERPGVIGHSHADTAALRPRHARAPGRRGPHDAGRPADGLGRWAIRRSSGPALIRAHRDRG
jgi:hypothetical protein